MSTGIIYSVAEGFKGLRRAKFSAFVSISTIFLSLLLIGVFTIFILNAKRLVNQVQSRLELEIFIDNSYTIDQIDDLKDRIIKINEIDSVRYISKEEAAAIFKQEFGKDIFEILDDNPLPSSFQVKLKSNFRSAVNAKQISDKLSKFEGVDQVFYRQDLLLVLERYIKIFVIIMFGIGLLLGIGSIFLVSNTIKLIILSRGTIIEIMKLVGATRRFIRSPFVVEGIIQGLIGGCFAALFFDLIIRIIKLEIPGLILINPRRYLFLIILGIFLGLVGSLMSLRKFLKY